MTTITATSSPHPTPVPHRTIGPDLSAAPKRPCDYTEKRGGATQRYYYQRRRDVGARAPSFPPRATCRVRFSAPYRGTPPHIRATTARTVYYRCTMPCVNGASANAPPPSPPHASYCTDDGDAETEHLSTANVRLCAPKNRTHTSHGPGRWRPFGTTAFFNNTYKNNNIIGVVQYLSTFWSFFFVFPMEKKILFSRVFIRVFWIIFKCFFSKMLKYRCLIRLYFKHYKKVRFISFSLQK